MKKIFFIIFKYLDCRLFVNIIFSRDIYKIFAGRRDCKLHNKISFTNVHEYQTNSRIIPVSVCKILTAEQTKIFLRAMSSGNETKRDQKPRWYDRIRSIKDNWYSLHAWITILSFRANACLKTHCAQESNESNILLSALIYSKIAIRACNNCNSCDIRKECL